MTTATYSPSALPPASIHAKPVTPTWGVEPLVLLERVVEYIGDDPDMQRQVFDLCLDLLVTKLPRLRQAMNSGDNAAILRLVHMMRGSLGMLGLPRLQELGEEIEQRHDNLGEGRWQLQCEQLYDLLVHVHQELQEKVAA